MADAREWVPWSTRPGGPGWWVEPNGCWIWEGACTKNGYGVARDPLLKKARLVRVMTWEMRRGPVPEGRELEQRCADLRCCNPQHMRAVVPMGNQHRRERSRGHLHARYLTGWRYPKPQ